MKKIVPRCLPSQIYVQNFFGPFYENFDSTLSFDSGKEHWVGFAGKNEPTATETVANIDQSSFCTTLF